MDDFGTGYSSLDTLHSFPFDKIKIDKSFLQQSSHSPQAAAIVRAVLAWRSLSIPVLAEGVETDEQVALRCAKDARRRRAIGRPMALNTNQTIRAIREA
jgi:EAL domain-containing protein (putative c-di-GMP-specific phosphodiesterase class I)